MHLVPVGALLVKLTPVMPFYFEQSDFPINVALPVMTLVLDLFSGDVGARKRNNKNYQTSVLPSAR